MAKYMARTEIPKLNEGFEGKVMLCKLGIVRCHAGLPEVKGNKNKSRKPWNICIYIYMYVCILGKMYLVGFNAI